MCKHGHVNMSVLPFLKAAQELKPFFTDADFLPMPPVAEDEDDDDDDDEDDEGRAFPAPGLPSWRPRARWRGVFTAARTKSGPNIPEGEKNWFLTDCKAAAME
jgi:hypothetical protein